MGRFRQWGSMLARATAHPVFARMRETGEPIPVDPRVFYPWAEEQPKPDRYKLMSVFRNFTMSERYSRAVAAVGAHYHDFAGNPTRPMPAHSVESALANLENIERWRAERLATDQTEPKAAARR